MTDSGCTRALPVVVKAVYRSCCGSVMSSSWWNSCIFWIKIKYEFKATYQGKVAINLNPEVDVGWGEVGGENATHHIIARI